MVSNGGLFEKGMKAAPDASASDGVFDVVIVRGGSRLASWQLMKRLRHGAHLDHRLVSIHRAHRVEA
jgi:diacylglycerol kinase family enzyme